MRQLCTHLGLVRVLAAGPGACHSSVPASWTPSLPVCLLDLLVLQVVVASVATAVNCIPTLAQCNFSLVSARLGLPASWFCAAVAGRWRVVSSLLLLLSAKQKYTS